MVLGHIEFILDIVPMLYRFVPDENHVVIPIFLVFLNFYFYHKCCMEDPGIINAKTVDRYKNVYPYDGRMFKSGVTCVTCHLEKPARSKHCSKFSLRTFQEEIDTCLNESIVQAFALFDSLAFPTAIQVLKENQYYLSF